MDLGQGGYYDLPEFEDLSVPRDHWERMLSELGSAASSDTNIISTQTGMPGRPSKGKNLIEDEFRRRIRDGEALPDLADEARAILDWYKAKHPKAERPTAKTIKNNIRADHREWMASQRETDAKQGQRPKL
jgi:hypothetical protein